jgi:hypothetical protein
VLADPTLGAYLLDMAINYLVLAAAAGVYFGLVIAGARINRAPARSRRSLLDGVGLALGFAVIALPTYVAVGMLFRHDPVGPGGLQRPPDSYVPAAQAAFYAIQVMTILLGSVRSRQTGVVGGRRVALASAGLVIVFLVLVQPLAEFANACYIGTSFLLDSSC